MHSLVVLNPRAGRCQPQQIRQALDRHLAGDHPFAVYEMTGRENLDDVVTQALAKGVERIIVAGGDGTVSGVADGLANTAVPLGIIPVGTGNALARDLSIPLGVDEACALLNGRHAIRAIDAIKVQDHHFLLRVGVGFDSVVLRQTPDEGKQWLGPVAYLWTAFQKLFGFQLCHFALTVDGRAYTFNAVQVMIVNSAALSVPGLAWAPNVLPDDGRLDVAVIKSRTIWDYLRLLGNTIRQRQQQDEASRYLDATETVTVTAIKALPVHGDGEVIGRTPITARVVSPALQVIVPPD